MWSPIHQLDLEEGMRTLKVLCAVTIALMVSMPAFAAGDADPRLITVTGDAEVRVAPDEVVLTLGVETWDKDLAAAKNQNDERTQRILKLAPQFGIDSKSLSVNRYCLL